MCARCRRALNARNYVNIVIGEVQVHRAPIHLNDNLTDNSIPISIRSNNQTTVIERDESTICYPVESVDNPDYADTDDDVSSSIFDLEDESYTENVNIVRNTENSANSNTLEDVSSSIYECHNENYIEETQQAISLDLEEIPAYADTNDDISASIFDTVKVNDVNQDTYFESVKEKHVEQASLNLLAGEEKSYNSDTYDDISSSIFESVNERHVKLTVNSYFAATDNNIITDDTICVQEITSFNPPAVADKLISADTDDDVSSYIFDVDKTIRPQLTTLNCVAVAENLLTADTNDDVSSSIFKSEIESCAEKKETVNDTVTEFLSNVETDDNGSSSALEVEHPRLEDKCKCFNLGQIWS